FDSFRGLNPRAWFMAIVRNACWSHLSRKRPPDEVFDEERDTPAVLQLQPEGELLRADQARRIHDEVAALRPEVREVFVLREVEGLSYKALAAAVALVPRADPLADEAIAAHARSLQLDHALDVPTSDQHTVKPWFEGKVGFAVPVRDYSADGFALAGGRLDYLDGRPAAAI